jgi:N-acetylneuraminate transport system permease protein
MDFERLRKRWRKTAMKEKAIDKYKWNWKKVDYSAYLFILPVMVFFLSFVLYPMLKGIHLSLYRFRGRNISFVGFKHYINLFQNDIFLKSAWNTVFITFVALPIVVVFSIFVAYVIYEKNAVVRSFFRGIFYIPAISSVVSITVVWNWIYHPKFGILNYVFQKMHVISGPVDWLGNPKTAIFAIIAILITTSVGQPIILYVAALGNVPKDLIEASEIDGANKWQAFKNVTWPLIMPTTLYIVVVTTINSFQIFALIQLLTHGGPNYTTSTVMYLVYQTAIAEGRFGVSSAMGIILAIIIGIISILQFKFLSKDID